MNLLHGHSVGLAFRLGNGLIDTQRVIPHRLGQGQVGHNVGDIRHAGVVVMVVFMVMDMLMVMVVLMGFHGMVMMMLVVMVMIVMMLVVMVMIVMMLVVVLVAMVMMLMFKHVVMAVLLLAVCRHRHMGAQDAALGRLLHDIGHAGDSQGIELLQRLLGIGHQLQQRAHEHIPCCAHFAFEIQCFHLSPPICAIMLAK